MKNLIVLLLIFISLSLASVHKWNQFKKTHSKNYNISHEEIYRYIVFKKNLEKIDNHNKLHDQGLVTFRMAVNKFADLTEDEFKNFLGLHQIKKSYKNNINESSIIYETFQIDNKFKSFRSLDWRKHGVVTKVKNQLQCGSCWSFSATGALEGQYAKKNKKLVSLSEQNLIDCSLTNGNDGCNGGWMDYAFEYVTDNGIDTEVNYPYEGKDNFCHFNKKDSILNVKKIIDIPKGNERLLKLAVALHGPVSVAIDATTNMQFYSSGYYQDTYCSQKQLNHGVLVVGYDVLNKNKKYWIVKNSWGDDWGEKGYIKMARNNNNNCGIASAASVPIIH